MKSIRYPDKGDNTLPKGYLVGETLIEFATRTARRNFPGCSDEFIRDNLTALNFQGQVDYHCTCCDGSYCKFDGHQPALELDESGLFVVQVASRDVCYKYRRSSQETK